MVGKSNVPLRRTCGISALLPALAGAFVALLLVVAPPPAEAGAVQVGGPASDIESAASDLLKRAEEIEAELARTPGDEALLAQLTRTRINAANTLINDGAGESTRGVAEFKKQFALARVAWSKYLKVAEKPSVALAILAAPSLFQLAELASNSREALKNVKAAVRPRSSSPKAARARTAGARSPSTSSSRRTTRRPTNRSKRRSSTRKPSTNAKRSKSSSRKWKKLQSSSAES